jgi:hypothetical protein
MVTLVYFNAMSFHSLKVQQYRKTAPTNILSSVILEFQYGFLCRGFGLHVWCLTNLDSHLPTSARYVFTFQIRVNIRRTFIFLQRLYVSEN